jgi:transglutaminase-like putative cysteine protease
MRLFLSNTVLKLQTMCFLLLLAIVPGKLMAQLPMELLNPLTYHKAKAAYPKESFADVNRSVHATLVNPPKGSTEPMVWQYVEKSDRISISNERYHQVYYMSDDFRELKRTRFFKVNGPRKQPIDISPRNIMLDNNELFHTNYKLSLYETYVTNPGEILSSILDYQINSIRHGGYFSFAKPIPAMEAEIVIEIPKWVKVRIEEINFDKFDIQSSKTETGNMVVYTYRMREVPASKSEPRSVAATYYLPYVVVIPEEMNHPKKGYQRIMKSLDDTYVWYKDLVKKSENKPESLKKLVTELTAGKDSVAQIEAIYYWVQDNIRYLAFEDGWAGFIPDNCQNVYQKRYGDCKGMANLIKEMLVLAGFDARLVWVGTRDKIALPIEWPVIINSNHMIAAVKWKGDWVFLDGTYTSLPLFEYPDQIQGQGVLLEGRADKDYEVLQVPQVSAAQNKRVNVLHLQLDESDASLFGAQTLELNGSLRTQFRNAYTMTPQNKRDQFLRDYMASGQDFKGFKDLQLDFNESDRAQPIALKADVIFQGQVLKLEQEMYLPSAIHKRFKYIKIPKDRLSDVTLGRKSYDTDTVIYQIPKGYKVNSLPKSVKISHEKYDFNFEIKEQSGSLISICTIVIKDFIIQNTDFVTWNDAIDQVKAFYDDQIILKK